MLTIRQDQIDLLRASAEAGFEPNVIAMVRRRWARACDGMTDVALSNRIQRVFAAATDFGIVSLRARVRFLNIVFALGDDAFERPSFETTRRLLAGAALDEMRTVDALVQWALLELRSANGNLSASVE